MLKQYISKIMRKKIFYRYWRKLYELSLYGMNMGPASGYTDYSGEDWIIKYIKSNINSSCPVIFDVGANVGDYSSAVIAAFGRQNVSLYCIEPSPETFQMLRVNLHEDENVRLFNIGFSDKSGTATLYSAGKGEGAASIFRGHFYIGENAAHVEEISMATLDGFCCEHDIKKIHFLKMDVEGNEMSIFRGASQMIETCAIDFIQFEFAFPNVASGVFFKDIFSCLNGNYRIYRSLVDGIIEIGTYDYKDEIFVTQNFLAISRFIAN